MVQVVMELNECVALEIARRQGSQEMYSMGSVVTLVSLLLQSLPREPDNLKICPIRFYAKTLFCLFFGIYLSF